MEFTKYDYYGNYENNGNDDLYCFSIQDIHKKQKDKENNRINIYKKIASKCFKKIKETSVNEGTFCFYRIPEYIPGLPIYNITECVMFILNLLKDKGFKARYCDGFYIYISWNIPKPNLKLIEPIKPTYERKDIIDELDLKYKPIESYRGLSNFIPMKKY
jgi:hypothetical protein